MNQSTKVYKEKACSICINTNCKHNIKYEEQGNIKRTYCPNYIAMPIKVTQREKREMKLDENDYVKFALYLKG